jgi:hypothetical protein
MRSDQIERLHLTDLVIWPGGDDPFTDENVLTACAELATGLLVQYSILIPAFVEQTKRGPIVTDYPVVRFTGSRNQLEELLNRYHGVEGAFDPAPFNPDAPKDPGFIGTDPTGHNWDAVDPEMRRTLSGS